MPPVWVRNVNNDRAVVGIELEIGKLVEVKIETKGMLLRVTELGNRTTGGREGKCKVITAEDPQARARLAGKSMAFHLCRGQASAEECTKFVSLRGIHIDAARVLTHAQAVPLSWMAACATAIRADEAAVLAGQGGASARSSAAPVGQTLSSLVTLSDVAPSPKKRAGVSASPVEKRPSPDRDSHKFQADLDKAKFLSRIQDEALKHGVHFEKLKTAKPPDVSPKAKEKADLDDLIFKKHELQPGRLAEKWLTEVTFRVKHERGIIRPVVQDYLRDLKLSDKRIKREAENWALTIDYLIQEPGVTAASKGLDVAVQRLKGLIYAADRMPKVAKDKKSKVWEAASKYELVSTTMFAHSNAETRAVEREVKSDARQGTVFKLNLDSSDEHSSDSSLASDDSSAIPRKKKSKKRKKKKNKPGPKPTPATRTGS